MPRVVAVQRQRLEVEARLTLTLSLSFLGLPSFPCPEYHPRLDRQTTEPRAKKEAGPFITLRMQ